jgi:penicillin-binding protein 1A
MLEGVVQRDTAVLRDLDRPLFGKTGTTGPTNVWFIGGSACRGGRMLVYDQPRSTGAMYKGGSLAITPIFKAVRKAISRNAENAVRPRPSGTRA